MSSSKKIKLETVEYARCSVASCENVYARTMHLKPNIVYYSFPYEENIASQWRNFCQQPDVSCNLHFICSEHFTNDDYLMDENGWKALKSDAVPTIYINEMKAEEIDIDDLCNSDLNGDGDYELDDSTQFSREHHERVDEINSASYVENSSNDEQNQEEHLEEFATILLDNSAVEDLDRFDSEDINDPKLKRKQIYEEAKLALKLAASIKPPPSVKKTAPEDIFGRRVALQLKRIKNNKIYNDTIWLIQKELNAAIQRTKPRKCETSETSLTNGEVDVKVTSNSCTDKKNLDDTYPSSEIDSVKYSVNVESNPLEKRKEDAPITNNEPTNFNVSQKVVRLDQGSADPCDFNASMKLNSKVENSCDPNVSMKLNSKVENSCDPNANVKLKIRTDNSSDSNENASPQIKEVSSNHSHSSTDNNSVSNPRLPIDSKPLSSAPLPHNNKSVNSKHLPADNVSSGDSSNSSSNIKTDPPPDSASTLPNPPTSVTIPIIVICPPTNPGNANESKTNTRTQLQSSAPTEGSVNNTDPSQSRSTQLPSSSQPTVATDILRVVSNLLAASIAKPN